MNRLIDEGRLPHLLFYGPPGTGKTSTILAVAKQIYGSKAAQMTLHLNASDDRGIGVVRNNIQEFASTRRLFSSGFKLVVLDECDAMTKDAQFALRRVIEKYASSTRFCLICNYVNKIIPALQSRCTRFRFAPLPREYIRVRVKEIAQQEGAEVQPEAVEALVALGGGHAADAQHDAVDMHGRGGSDRGRGLRLHGPPKAAGRGEHGRLAAQQGPERGL